MKKFQGELRAASSKVGKIEYTYIYWLRMFLNKTSWKVIKEWQNKSKLVERKNVVPNLFLPILCHINQKHSLGCCVGVWAGKPHSRVGTGDHIFVIILDHHHHYDYHDDHIINQYHHN